MGLSGIIRFITRRIFELIIIAFLIVLLPNIPPEGSFSKSYTVAPPRPFEGALKLNDKLNDVDIWHKGDVHGPEAFVDYKGQLYTTLHGGDIVKLSGDKITPVVRFGKACNALHEEQLCGRPLGMAVDKYGAFYIADAYYGLFKVDIETGKKEQLVGVNDQIEDVNVTFPNSVTVASNGDLFWTESSTEFSLQDGIFEMLGDGSGRLIQYNLETKKNTVLIKDLHFGNGVALAEDESFILVSELARNRIQRFYLKGPKKGTHDIFIDGLPGVPDNLKIDGKGGFIVSLVIPVDNENPLVTQTLGPYPLLRKFIARVFGLVEFTFKFIDNIYPNQFSKKGVHFIGHFTMTNFMQPKRVTILHVSKDGEIVDSLHCLNKKLGGISEAHIFQDHLYLGSPFNDYIGRIPLAKIGWEHLKRNTVPKIIQKEVQDQPKAAPVKDSSKKN